jgi:hypothetical protein
VWATAKKPCSSQSHKSPIGSAIQAENDGLYSVRWSARVRGWAGVAHILDAVGRRRMIQARNSFFLLPSDGSGK